MSDTHSADPMAGLEPAERAYFESRGEKTEGLAVDPPAADPVIEPVKEPAKTEPEKVAAEPVKDAKTETKPDPAAAERDADEEELGEDGRPKNPGRYVRHGAFREERERRKAAEKVIQERDALLAQMQEKYARGDERLRLLNEALRSPATEAKKDEPAAPPDPEKDIFGFVKWQGEQINSLRSELGKVADTTSRQFQAQQSESNLERAYLSDAQSFMAKTPDWGSAYQHLLQTRDRQLQIAGVADPARRLAQIHAEEKSIVGARLQAGLSPAEAIYQMAATMGYQPPAAVIPNGGNGAQPVTHTSDSAGAHGNGTSNGVAAAGMITTTEPEKPSVSAEIARIQAGQAAAKSLSSVGGGASVEDSLESIASMGDKEFEAFLAKKGDDFYKRLGKGAKH